MERPVVFQFLRFMLIGTIATIIDYSVMILFKELFKVEVLIATAIGYIIAFIFNYLLNMKYVFIDTKEGMTKVKVAIIFLVTSLIGLALNQLIMYLLTEKILMHYIIAKLFSIMVVGLWNFFSKKLMIEK